MRQNQKGFTLIETIVYLLIVGVILSTLALFLLHVMNARTKTYAISEVISSANLIQERLSEAVRHSTSLRVADSTFGTDPGVLSLNMADPARTPVEFSLTSDNGQLQISEAGGDPVILSPANVYISELIFTNLTSVNDAGMIQVKFTAEVTSDSGTKAFEYDQSFQTTLRIPLD